MERIAYVFALSDLFRGLHALRREYTNHIGVTEADRLPP